LTPVERFLVLESEICKSIIHHSGTGWRVLRLEFHVAILSSSLKVLKWFDYCRSLKKIGREMHDVTYWIAKKLSAMALVGKLNLGKQKPGEPDRI
jgi:hypothetical protein